MSPPDGDIDCGTPATKIDRRNRVTHLAGVVAVVLKIAQPKLATRVLPQHFTAPEVNRTQELLPPIANRSTSTPSPKSRNARSLPISSGSSPTDLLPTGLTKPSPANHPYRFDPQHFTCPFATAQLRPATSTALTWSPHHGLGIHRRRNGTNDQQLRGHEPDHDQKGTRPPPASQPDRRVLDIAPV